MKNATDLDLLIIGQGLAGSAVAIRALARNYRIMVIDEPSQNISSAIAAGLFNPVTGRKMVKTWLADELFVELHRFYPGVERMTGKKFFHPMPVYRPFFSVEEQNEWMGKSVDMAYRDFVGEVSGSPRFGDTARDPFGGLLLKQCGYLDTRTYLAAVRGYLSERGSIIRGQFQADKLEIAGGTLRYGSLQPRKIIFCQGTDNNSNPWFRRLPVNSLKGELLTIQCGWEKRVILNRGVFMVPGSDPDRWCVGATYHWNDQSREITSSAKIELSEKLESILRLPYTILDQQWGFRPTTPDRKPVIGAHPDHPSLIIFNGLGTKGVSLAPYFSEVLFRWMENEGTLMKQADVTRFY